ncbi:carboxypeptidase-like regulatory domain-containing protein [Tenacibaculum caenipelagi]|uniref:Carboxypeptidase-like protein n=1 Tax=Tenacibaculum caenipelagi TaxID=1325435 RepID=A0A4R6THU1_9FLAO|nr:carboxypeptidase-like regulatory domain-containing protein [Tenacibaculum caenipelagi]TDQ25757.1 carboxypeptidase-like protein [Tenacibaculum caenipelagi]
MIKQLPFTLLFIITLKISAQENRKFLYATVNDELGSMPNVHVINLNTKQGTFTNDNGEFRILAKPNDTLRLSFVGYETNNFKIKINHFGIVENKIELKKEVIELDEVQIKKHNLTGSLYADLKQTPKDIAKEKTKSALDFSKINFKESVVSDIDIVARGKAPNMRKETDPTAKFAGVGGGVSSGPDKYSQELKRTRKEINFKENFPEKLLSEFGSHFFFVELKIPKEKYLHFLEYCNSLEIEKLYKNGNILKVINILQQESYNYLKIIKEKE